MKDSFVPELTREESNMIVNCREGREDVKRGQSR